MTANQAGAAILVSSRPVTAPPGTLARDTPDDRCRIAEVLERFHAHLAAADDNGEGHGSVSQD